MLTVYMNQTYCKCNNFCYTRNFCEDKSVLWMHERLSTIMLRDENNWCYDSNAAKEI